MSRARPAVLIVLPGVPRFALGLLLLAALPPTAQALGEELIDAIMRSDFVFDRELSNAPFLPLAIVNVRDYATTSVDGACDLSTDCRFDDLGLSLTAGLPLWAGQRDLMIAGGSLALDRLEAARRGRTIYSAGALGAWVRQASPDWQLGAFVFPQWHSGVRGGRADAGQVIAGAIARQRHSARFHTYYGVVWASADPESYLLPYFGLDWYPNKEWVVSLLAPWPALVWAPSKRWLIRFGASPAGATWQFEGDDGRRSADLSRWNLGVAYEGRLRRQLWWGIETGLSGLEHLRISDGADLNVGADLDGGGYVELFLTFRPEVLQR